MATYHKFWTRDRMLEYLRKWVETHDGRIPKQTEWIAVSDNNPCWTSVAREFGGWNAFIIAGGFTPRPASRPSKYLQPS